jgi:hypothetical protein
MTQHILLGLLFLLNPTWLTPTSLQDTASKAFTIGSYNKDVKESYTVDALFWKIEDMDNGTGISITKGYNIIDITKSDNLVWVASSDMRKPDDMQVIIVSLPIVIMEGARCQTECPKGKFIYFTKINS